MKIQTTDLLHFLPISKDIKEKLLSRFESFSDDQKLAVSKICWKMYYALYDARVQQELQTMLVETTEKPEKLSKESVQDIKKNIHDEFIKAISEKKEESTIGKVREDLESLIKTKSEPLPSYDTPLDEPPLAPVINEAASMQESSKSQLSKETIQKIRVLLNELESQLN